MTDSRYLLDSSAWIGYLQDESQEINKILAERKLLLTSAISFYEIKKKFIKRHIKEALIQKALGKIRENSETMHITGKLCEKAVEASMEYGLHAIDALIYRSAIENDATLITMDCDFHKLPGVKIIEQD